MTRLALSLTAALCLASLAAPPAVATQAEGTDAERLHDLFAREWEWRLAEFPTLASSVGRHEYDDRLTDVSLEAIERRADDTREFLFELATIDRERLDRRDRVSHAIFHRQLADRLADFGFGAYQIPINADSGFHTSFARLPANARLLDTGDYENYLARLRAWPRHVEQRIDLMRMGLERGFTQPKVILEGYDVTIASHVVDDPEESVFFEPFQRFPVGVPHGERDRLAEAGRAAIAEAVVPGYATFLEFMREEYVPGAIDEIGALNLPEGRDYYQQRIRHFTTLELTPEEIHDIGLAEVARIRAEMEAVIEEVGFEGTFDEFLEFLRTDPRFYPQSAEELLREAAWIAKRADGALPALFGKLPRLPYTVEPVPDHIAPKYTAGRYVGAPVGSTRPGAYWVNTYDLDSRSLYTLEALTLHEAVPGHHLQNALSQEQGDLPDFRRHSYISAFGEGWGLYSEWLGLEAGFYTDPYSNFGRLTYEMWRACRLVVDTGIHAMGWSRQQVLDYLAENTALSLHEITTETDRYISWPGQALAYKLGEIEIRRLRREAEAELGSDFDVRAFHDAVLENGSVPLPVLAELIDEWVAAAKADAHR